MPAWRVEVDRAAARDLRKLGSEAERLILRYLRDRISGSDDPRRFGHALTGDRKGLWRYRVGDYRIVALWSPSVIGERSIAKAWHFTAHS